MRYAVRQKSKGLSFQTESRERTVVQRKHAFAIVAGSAARQGRKKIKNVAVTRLHR